MIRHYLLNISCLGILTILIGSLLVYDEFHRSGPLQNTTYVVLQKGFHSRQVAQALYESHIINSRLYFNIAARVMKLDKKLKAGEYIFEQGVALKEVLQKLSNGEVFYHKLTLPEGLTTAQILKIINEESALDGEITLIPEEGSLLPETYTFVRGDSKDNLVKQAQNAMNRALTEVWKNRADGLPLKSPQDLLTLASIIEKETGISDERKLVASVFINRLNKGMKLQTDPTVIYALTKGKTEMDRALTRKDLTIDDPYNTYKYYGLPPAPICNAGLASMRAAAQPAQSNYLYFVANGKGGHNFAASLKSHNDNVRNWKESQKHP